MRKEPTNQECPEVEENTLKIAVRDDWGNVDCPFCFRLHYVEEDGIVVCCSPRCGRIFKVVSH